MNIICGQYEPGDRLPGVRDLAMTAAVNPHTMQRALWELEQEHVFQKEGRPDYCANAGEDGLLILNWFLREAPPDLEDLEAVEVNGIRCPVE